MGLTGKPTLINLPIKASLTSYEKMLSSLLQNFNKIWLSIVALNLILLVLLPDWFSKESIVSLLDGLGAFALVTYIVVSLARALYYSQLHPSL